MQIRKNIVTIDTVYSGSLHTSPRKVSNMSIFSRFLPKRKPVEIQNNIPKEKAYIRKAFGMYCHKHHGTSGDKLCPKCTALLATVMTKMNRCPYGITKPICDRCDRPCFGPQQTKDFLAIMNRMSTRMFLRHPVMAFKHKLMSMGVEYAKYQQQKKLDGKIKAKEKASKERKKARKKK